MSNLIPFQFESNEIRVVTVGGEPWFVAADVCAVLGIQNTSMAVKALDSDEVTLSQIEGSHRPTNLINESGIFALVLRSDKPEAKPFRKWVTSEVLPSIRKTGSYSAQPRAGVSELRQVTPEFKAALSLAKAFGFKGNQAVLSANNTVRKLYGTDCAKLIDATHLIAEVQEPLLTPTDLGARLDGRSAVAVNKLLAELGFQLDKRDLHGKLSWELTETGKRYAVYMDTGKKRGDGTPVRQIRWLASVLNLIQPKAA